MKQLVVKPNQKGQPLLEYLADQLGLSKNKAKALLDQRIVYVNRRRIWMARHLLQTGDVVTMRTAERPPEAAPLTILFQDAHILVLSKPSGILSNGENSAEQTLRKKKALRNLTAVHRLDRDTSGCLIFAKTAAADAKMETLFRAREVSKVYHAIVLGRISRNMGTISKDMEGKSAVTRLQVIDVGPLATHLKLTIGTGRTHQIRRHCSSIGHPVLGDKQYGAPRQETTPALQAERHMLHASKVTFCHPVSGETIRVDAPLPPDFRSRLKKLGLK